MSALDLHPAPENESGTTGRASRSTLWLWALVPTLLVFTLILAVMAYYANELNIVRIESRPEMGPASGSAVDPKLTIMTASVLSQTCEIGDLHDCSVHDSSVVATLRSQTLPKTAKTLLDKNEYSSAYHLLKALIVRGADVEIPMITRLQGFDLTPLCRFATTWYLKAAILYTAANREEDALEELQYFVSITRDKVQNGQWLSREGLDATDIPVLIDLFCTPLGEAAAKTCSIGLLRVLKPLDNGQIPDVVNGFRGFPSAYRALPPPLLQPTIARYLDVWDWNLRGPVPTIPSATAAQNSAVHYVLGSKFARAALIQTDKRRCESFMQRGAAEFRRSMSSEAVPDYFSKPAFKGLQQIEKAQHACQN
jgi:hypothetical protein